MPCQRFYRLFCLVDASHNGIVGSPPPLPTSVLEAAAEQQSSLGEPHQPSAGSQSDRTFFQQSSGGGLFKALVLSVEEVGSASSL